MSHGRLACSDHHTGRGLADFYGVAAMRALLYFLVGFLLGGNAVLSHADFPATPPGTPVPHPLAGMPAVPVTVSQAAICGLAPDVAYHNPSNTAQFNIVGRASSPFSGLFETSSNIEFGSCGDGSTFARTANQLCPNGGTYVHPQQCSYSSNTCPTNSTLTGGGATCACNSGYVESSGTCVPAPTCTAGESVGVQQWLIGYDLNGDGLVDGQRHYPFATGLCVSGCHVMVDASKDVEAKAYAPLYTKIYGGATFNKTGGSCSGQPSPEAPNDSAPCPAGHVYGTVNGIPRCLSSSDKPPPAPTTTTTTADKVDNGNGTSTITTTTTTNNSVTTTTTIINNSTGEKISEVIETKKSGEDQGELSKFCEENPDSSLCKVSTISATCSAFTCDGDAIQCAIAKEIHTRNCQLLDDRSDPAAQLGDAVIAGTAVDGNDPRSLGNIESHDLSTQFNVTPRIGSSCIEDDLFDFAGQPIVIPWSNLCPYMQMAGNIFVLLTMIAALGIMFRQ